MPQVTLEHSDSSTETIAETVEGPGGWNYKHTREVGEMKKLQVHVSRSDAQSVTLEPKSDKLTLDGVGSGRLEDVEKDGAVWRLIAYGFDIDATAEPPLPGGDLRAGTDAEIVTELIGEVPSWSAGTVTAQTGGISFVVNHAFADEALRRFEASVPGELQWNDDASVDYVSELGADKTGSVTISVAQGNVEGEIRVRDWGRELDATHVRVIGAHEGEAQVFANLVPDGDSGNYANEVTYTTSRWSDASDTVWGRWPNKDVSSQAAIDEEAAALAPELTSSYIETHPVTVVGENLSVGDWVHVEKAEVDLDHDMRVIQITTVGKGPSEYDEVVFSTRTTARQRDSQVEETANQFYTSFQGSSVILQGGGDRQPVTSSDNAIIPFRYPDVAFEHVAELEVRGLPYRAFSSGAASSQTGEIMNTSIRNFTQGTIYDASSNSPFVNAKVPPPESGEFAGAIITYGYLNETGGSTDINMQVGVDGTMFEATTGTVSDNSGLNSTYIASSNEVSPGDNILYYIVDGDVGTESGNEDLGSMELYVETFTKHSHEPEPGIIDEFPDHPQADANDQLLPSGCDVVINGSEVATDIGSGSFETVVDITDELNKGEWNTIEVTSDTIGHILATPYIETYKQIGAN